MKAACRAGFEWDMAPGVVVSFWGEPFLSRATEQQAPRYILRIDAHADLVGGLLDLERKYRLLPP